MTTRQLQFRPNTPPEVVARATDVWSAYERGEHPTQHARAVYGARAVTLDGGVEGLEFTGITELVARDGSIIRVGGIDWSGFDENPVFLWMHGMDPKRPPIGKIIERRVDDDPALGLVVRFTTIPMAQDDVQHEHLTFVKMVFRAYRDRFMNMTSFAWQATRMAPLEGGGFDYLESDGHEFSAVNVGADKHALQRAAQSGIIKPEFLGEFDPRRALQVPYEIQLPPAPPAPAVPTLSGPAALARVHPAPALPDPLRLNRQLPEVFDIAAERLEPANPVYALVSRHLDCELKRVVESGEFVRATRMGAFLAALDETLPVHGWQVDDVRNLRNSGAEVPPCHEAIRLNSTTQQTFLVDGFRFLSGPQGRVVLRVQPDWNGLEVTTYAAHGAPAEALATTLARTHTRARELNFLQGEALTLGGEFLARGDVTWDDVFLTAPNEQILRQASERLAAEGADFANRGIMLLGPPGTGKTLSGRALMREAPDATFIWISARDFYRFGSYGGITHAFDLARECAPAILFFEDIDHWIGQTEVDLLKTELDGIARSSGVLTVLTTNFPERMPQALIDRPGRFHDLVKVDLPDTETRGRMLARWLPDLEAAARAEAVQQTAGYSGAHLYELAHFAHTLAVDADCDLPTAVQRALQKIADQREMIGTLRYAPSEAVTRAVTARRDASVGVERIRAFRWQPVQAEAPLAIDPADPETFARALTPVLQSLGLPVVPDATRIGAVLNRQNRETIERVIAQLGEAGAALHDVLRAAEKALQQDDEPAEDDATRDAMREELTAMQAQIARLTTLAETRRTESAAAAILRDVGSRIGTQAARLTETPRRPAPPASD